MERGMRVNQLIAEQARSWATARANAAAIPRTGKMLLVGSGTSYYLAKSAAEVGLRAGYTVEARPSEAILLDADVYLQGVTTLVVISRSGATSEAVWAVEAARKRSIHTVAVTCHAESPLSQLADQSLVSPQGEDDTVVMIRSFSSLLVMLQASLSTETTGDLAPYAHDLLAQAQKAVKTWRSTPRRVYLLGAGVREGIGQEGALKAQEMSGIAAYAYSPLEFRHGPRGSVTPDDLVVMLGQTAYASYEWDVLADLSRQGPELCAIARESWYAEQDGALLNHRLILPDQVPDVAAGPLVVIPLQWIAWSLAMAQGRDPDQPRNLTPVVSISRA